jgi:hypothetical protein
MAVLLRHLSLSFRGASEAREPGIHNHDLVLYVPPVVMDSGQPLRGFRNDGALS